MILAPIKVKQKLYFVSKIVLTYYQRNYLVIQKNFWNSRLKAENLQIFWESLFEQCKVRNFFETKYLSNLILEVYQIWRIGTIKMPTEKIITMSGTSLEIYFLELSNDISKHTFTIHDPHFHFVQPILFFMS